MATLKTPAEFDAYELNSAIKVKQASIIGRTVVRFNFCLLLLELYNHD